MLLADQMNKVSSLQIGTGIAVKFFKCRDFNDVNSVDGSFEI